MQIFEKTLSICTRKLGCYTHIWINSIKDTAVGNLSKMQIKLCLQISNLLIKVLKLHKIPCKNSEKIMSFNTIYSMLMNIGKKNEDHCLALVIVSELILNLKYILKVLSSQGYEFVTKKEKAVYSILSDLCKVVTYFWTDC